MLKPLYILRLKTAAKNILAGLLIDAIVYAVFVSFMSPAVMWIAWAIITAATVIFVVLPILSAVICTYVYFTEKNSASAQLRDMSIVLEHRMKHK